MNSENLPWNQLFTAGSWRLHRLVKRGFTNNSAEKTKVGWGFGCLGLELWSLSGAAATHFIMTFRDEVIPFHPLGCDTSTRAYRVRSPEFQA